MRLDQMSGIPLYVQIREKLRSELSEMEPGEPIPPKRNWTKDFASAALPCGERSRTWWRRDCSFDSKAGERLCSGRN